MRTTRLCILIISLATSVPAGDALAWEDNLGIAPIDSKITTVKTYADLGSEWWQWAVQAPATDNPLRDEDGSNCRVGQQGPVWFLAGTQGSGKPTVRRCEVPGGKAIFFPVINNAYFAFLSDPPEQRTAEFVRTTAETGCDSSSIRGLSVTIDGTRVAEPARFVTTAEQSPLFQAQLPTDNILGLTESQAPELLLSPAAHKGFLGAGRKQLSSRVQLASCALRLLIWPVFDGKRYRVKRKTPAAGWLDLSPSGGRPGAEFAGKIRTTAQVSVWRPSPMRNDKFDELVHYVIWKCPDATKLGATKLNKVLWFADAIHYLRTGHPITAARYVKQQHGPVPQGFLKTRTRLEKAHAIAVAEGEFYGYPQTRFMALRRPDISGFTADEISLVDEIIETIRDGHTATSISALTHDRVWEAAAIGEEMPLHAIYAARDAELTEEDMEWATEQCVKLGLTAQA